MSVRLIPLDAGPEFPSGRLAEIMRYLSESLPDVQSPIVVERVDVVVVPTQRPILGWDVNGFSMGLHWITLGIDPRCFGQEKRPLAQQLRAILAHELHHAKRQQGPGYGSTLGEALISEGLAQCYEEEVGCPTPNYATAVNGHQLDELALRAIEHSAQPFYDHGAWFYGRRGDPAFPWSGGYSLGYALVKDWLKDKNQTASQAVQTPASDFLSTAWHLFEQREKHP